ncbi:hypothetical protein EYF80_057591 [Liparis tanakae]|uniref:Uncharacterized protein n=1 Tax=Liparis tanakae TaxID=230148 RepID=A0A4Z2ETX9_9TELE|nr:hypothetical protein EYF80_057591 [Liparis tanakae]
MQVSVTLARRRARRVTANRLPRGTRRLPAGCSPLCRLAEAEPRSRRVPRAREAEPRVTGTAFKYGCASQINVARTRLNGGAAGRRRTLDEDRQADEPPGEAPGSWPDGAADRCQGGGQGNEQLTARGGGAWGGRGQVTHLHLHLHLHRYRSQDPRLKSCV